MRKFLASICFVVWFITALQFVESVAQLLGRWDDFADEGKVVEEGVVVRYDPMLGDRRTDGPKFDTGVENNAYQFYVQESGLRMESHAWWFVNHLYGGKLKWCVYPAAMAANLTSRIVDAAIWCVVLTAAWVGLWLAFFRKIAQTPLSNPETYLPIYYRPAIVVGSVFVYPIVSNLLYDNMSLFVVVMSAILIIFEIVRFILHVSKKISSVSFVARNMQRNAASEDGQLKKRSAFVRWWSRHFG